MSTLKDHIKRLHAEGNKPHKCKFCGKVNDSNWCVRFDFVKFGYFSFGSIIGILPAYQVGESRARPHEGKPLLLSILPKSKLIPRIISTV